MSTNRCLRCGGNGWITNKPFGAVLCPDCSGGGKSAPVEQIQECEDCGGLLEPGVYDELVCGGCAEDRDMDDPVNHPSHYTSHPSGVECLTVTRHMGFNLGNAVKYIWRSDLKGDAIEDLRKAAFYIEDEIERREAMLDTTLCNEPSPEPDPDLLAKIEDLERKVDVYEQERDFGEIRTICGWPVKEAFAILRKARRSGE